MNLLRRQPEYPEFYDARLAYDLSYNWGSVSFTEQAAVANRMWPLEAAKKSEFSTFADRLTAREQSDRNCFDVLVAGHNESLLVDEASVVSGGLLAHTAQDSRGVHMLVALSSEVAEENLFKFPPTVKCGTTDPALGAHACELGSVVEYWFGSQYADRQKVAHGQSLLSRMRKSSGSWVLLNAAMLSYNAAVDMPTPVYAAAPLATTVALGTIIYRTLRTDYDSQLMREQEWHNEGMETGRQAHSDIEHSFISL